MYIGTDFYTLPMLQVPSGEVIGDSFDIANYLEDTFPDSGGAAEWISSCSGVAETMQPDRLESEGACQR